jgi:hypothetical protein
MYGPGWRMSFGSSNERGGTEEAAIDDDDEVAKVATPASKGDLAKSEAPSEEKDELESEPEVKGEADNADVKPKRRARKRTQKGKDEAEDGPISAKKRKGERICWTGV